MSTLSNLFAILEHERTLLLDAIKKAPDEALTLKGLVGTWSIKNVLAHLADQERLLVQVLPERLATGITPEIVSVINADADAWNAKQISSIRSYTTFHGAHEPSNTAAVPALLGETRRRSYEHCFFPCCSYFFS